MPPIVLVLNGPNLNLLGTREPEVYGHATLADIDLALTTQAQAAGHQLDAFQSNAEHALVDRVQAARHDVSEPQVFDRRDIGRHHSIGGRYAHRHAASARLQPRSFGERRRVLFHGSQ